MHAILEKRADLSELGSFLGIVSRALRQYWDRELIVLIDEYDAPLETAGRRGYYDQMLFFIRSLFDCLKDRSEVTGAILTGCLRISKESVFTDTNNFVSHSIKDAEFADSNGRCNIDRSAFIPTLTHGEFRGFQLKSGALPVPNCRMELKAKLKPVFDSKRISKNAKAPAELCART